PATGWRKSTTSSAAAPGTTRTTRAPWRRSRSGGASRRCRPTSGRHAVSVVAIAPMQPCTPIRELETRDAARVSEVLAGGEPVVLRTLVADWPAVAAGRGSPGGVLEYLRRFDSGVPVDAIMTPPELAGRIFYREGLD